MLKTTTRSVRPDTEINEQGFTLVELLVTIVVLGLVITSLAGLYYLNQINQVQSQHYDIALRAARSEIEDLRNSGYVSLTPSTVSFTSSLPSTLPSSKTGTVVITQPATGLLRVDVTVAYNDYGKAQSITLSSDIGVIGIGEGQ